MNLERNKSDVLCKKLLRLKGIVAYILKDCLDELEGIRYEDVLQSLSENNDSEVIHLFNSEDITKADSKVFYDLLSSLKTEDEEIMINLEPQGKYPGMKSLLKRTIYISSRMIVWQRNEPDGFQGSEFENLKKTVSIWVMLQPPKKYEGEQLVIDDYAECQDFKKALKMRRIIVLFLHKKIDTTNKSASMMLSVLFDEKMSMDEKIFILKEEYGILISRKGEEIMGEWYNTADAFIERGIEQGIEQGIQKGIEQGIQRGIEQGIEIGKEQGIEQGVEQVACQLLRLGNSVEMISEACNLSYEEITRLKETL